MPRSSPRTRLVSLFAAFVLAPSLNAADPNWFPDDTEAVVVVNLKQIFNGEALRNQPDARGELEGLLGGFASLDAVQKYLAEANLRIFRDVRVVGFAFASNKEPGPSLVIVEGDFDAEKLATAAKGSRVKIAKNADQTIYEFAPRGEKPMFAALVEPSTLIAAPTGEALAAALARRAGSKKSALKKEVRAALAAVGDRQSIAFVASGPALARVAGGAGLPNADKAVAFLKTLDVAAGGITLDKDIQFQLAVNAESEASAGKLAESANGSIRILLTLVRQTADRDARYRPVVDVVEGLRFSNVGADIRLRGRLTLDAIEKLLQNFPAAPPARSGK